MIKQKPLWERLYFDPAYIEIARLIGYRGTTYRDMMRNLEPLEEKFGKQRVHSAAYFLVTFEGQMTCNPKPLTDVQLRPDVRHLCWQLLGPPPEKRGTLMMNSGDRPEFREETTSAKPPMQEKRPASDSTSNKPLAKKPRQRKATSTEQPVPAHQADMGKNTIIEQYQAAKEKHPGMMLLFRVGEFYELFYQDAAEVSKLLGLTLTTRDRVHPMAGFPHHQLQPYLQKLLQAGRRVAICDQVETSGPDGTTEPVREVQRVLSPQEHDQLIRSYDDCSPP